MKSLPGLPKASTRKGLGDFQTPPALVAAVLDRLGPIGDRYARALEPTCGRGAFLSGLLERPDPPREIRGFEIQPDHFEAARQIAEASRDGVRIRVELADIFRVDLSAIDWSDRGRLLVVGNLPWVTNAFLGTLGNDVPTAKVNPRGSRGIDALTGSSNFDISEPLWLKLIRELAPQRPTIALLGKTAVARELFRSIETAHLPVVSATLYRIDARRWFGASVDAGLLVMEIGPGRPADELVVYDDLDARGPAARIGRTGDRLIADLEAYRRAAHADGISPIEWRQGVKHDAAGVMELEVEAGAIRNKRGEPVDVEGEYLYPLMKGSDLVAGDRPRPRRLVVVTQRRLNISTDALQHDAPRLWDYLQRHGEDFDRRRSSIYQGRPRFVLFGVGEYTFAPFKVAVSGMHKEVHFRVVGPVEERPVLFDDTCYFLPFDTREAAEATAERLNGRDGLDLIRALSFRDAKRPITKSLLRRIDLAALRLPGDDGRGTGRLGVPHRDDSDLSPRSMAHTPTRRADGLRDDPISEPIPAEGVGIQHRLPR